MSVSAEQVRHAFRNALSSGDDVLVHASLGRIGHLEAGVDDAIDALLEAIGDSGTLVMMADTRSFARTGAFSIDQPSETGLITERFRVRAGVTRSAVPMVSFCALGPKAAYYTRPYNSHLDPEATISRLLESDGKIMLLGVGYEKCTLYHLAEERHQTPYNFHKIFTGTLFDGGQPVGPISQRYFVRRDMGVKKNPLVAGEMLEQRRQVRIEALGEGLVRTFKARDFDRCCMDALSVDPQAFIAK